MEKLEISDYIAGLVQKAKAAMAQVVDFDQTQLNRMARAAGKAVYDNAELFAKEAVEETHMGTVDGKIKKMRGSMTQQWAYAKDRPSTGVVGWEKGKLDKDCILKIAKPAGVIAAVMPVTNPTTTFGANAMQALKGGNAIIVCPHPRAKNVSNHCCQIIRDAVSATGAPADLVQCIEEPAIEMTSEAMRQADLIVATGGPGMVKAANSCGNPSLGVGQGNCQVVIDRGFADRFDAITADITANRAYDSGIPCTGEQTIIIPEEDKQAFYEAFERNHGKIITDQRAIDKLRELLFEKNEKTGAYRADPKYVGMNIQKLCSYIGVDLPDDVLSIGVELHSYGPDERLCKEKMCPVSGIYAYKGDWKDAVNIACTNLYMEGAGHSTDIYTDSKENQLYAGKKIPVCRMPVNTGQNAVNGRPYYTGGMPTTSGLGCGYWQKNILGTNLTFEHLLNYTRLLFKVDAETPDIDEKEVWAEI